MLQVRVPGERRSAGCHTLDRSHLHHSYAGMLAVHGHCACRLVAKVPWALLLVVCHVHLLHVFYAAHSANIDYCIEGSKR